MKIYVVFHQGEGEDTTLHSAHYSKWMAELTTENMNKEHGLVNAKWEHYYYQEVELLPESA